MPAIVICSCPVSPLSVKHLRTPTSRTFDMSTATYYTPQQQQLLLQQQAQQQAILAEQQRQQQFMQQYQKQYSPQQLESMMANPAATAATFDETVHLTTDDFDQHTDRTLYVKLEGSLAEFARGTIKPTWHADEGCEHIYMRIAGMDGGRPVYDGDTGKGLILGMTLETLASTFPVDIGAVITGTLPPSPSSSRFSKFFFLFQVCRARSAWRAARTTPSLRARTAMRSPRSASSWPRTRSRALRWRSTTTPRPPRWRATCSAATRASRWWTTCRRWPT